TVLVRLPGPAPHPVLPAQHGRHDRHVLRHRRAGLLDPRLPDVPQPAAPPPPAPPHVLRPVYPPAGPACPPPSRAGRRLPPPPLPRLLLPRLRRRHVPGLPPPAGHGRDPLSPGLGPAGPDRLLPVLQHRAHEYRPGQRRPPLAAGPRLRPEHPHHPPA